MEKVHITIIGAGIVGLAIAERLSRSHQDVLLIEKSDRFGTSTSSRNSEVIHAGFYYPENTLKALLCVEGNPLTYEICATNNIQTLKTGKLVIACRPEENQKIESLFEQGRKNGVPDLEMLSAKAVARMEPAVAAAEALFSPTTGILDSHRLMACFEFKAENNGATIVYNCEVISVSHNRPGYTVMITDSDGDSMEIASEIVINCAGLDSDTIAASAGLDIDDLGLRLHPCKGEYFAVSGRHSGKLNHLVYPAPTPISLGTHAVIKLDGSLKLGPNAFYVDEINYDVDPNHADEFFEDSACFFPFLKREDLSPDMSGIRPKLQAANDRFHDFVIRDEAKNGLAGFINLIGIESPGLTSAPAIATHVEKIVDAL